MLQILRRLFRDPRAVGALCLLVTLVAGEAADARHHLADQGCVSDGHVPGQRDDNCTCAGLHVLPLGDQAPASPAPVVREREFAPVVAAAARVAHRGAASAPRAPPRG